ncbi:homeobox protein H2.0 [Eurosta solidaginis]|uniref:homeobox protein H2.0 n=1 Tax=Eurosta solidaginis TaxID=178769 RepID=UPI0035310DCD
MGVLEIDRCLNVVMESMPTNLTMEGPSAGSAPLCSESVKEVHVEFSKSLDIDSKSNENNNKTKLPGSIGETKIQLSFSVDRLLNSEKICQPEFKNDEIVKDSIMSVVDCFHNPNVKEYKGSCAHPNCSGIMEEVQPMKIENSTLDFKRYSVTGDCYNLQERFQNQMPILRAPCLDFRSIVRPTPIRATSNRREAVPQHPAYPALTTTALLRFQQHQKSGASHSQIFTAPQGLLSNMSGNGTTVNFGFKSFHNTQSFIATPPFSTRFPALKTHAQHLLEISMSTTNLINHHRPLHSHIAQNSNTSPSVLCSNTATQMQLPAANSGNNTCINISNNNSNGTSGAANNGSGKRKRSWSRAVFSNLQRKGLEIQFQQQKYITKPDRRKLAARLNLTDAQVKVWFQNRRMKWRHTRENLKSGQEKQMSLATSGCPTVTGTASNSKKDSNSQKLFHENHALDGYSSDDPSCGELSDNEDDIDVVQ